MIVKKASSIAAVKRVPPNQDGIKPAESAISDEGYLPCES